jgi:histidine triad (HIT) family protein
VTSDCLFCRIVRGEIPSRRVYEDEHVVAFDDIQPAAPVHVLVVPREHIASLDGMEPGHHDLAGHLLLSAARVAREVGIAERGYRTIVNTGDDGGQTVGHLHLHLLGGKRLKPQLL